MRKERAESRKAYGSGQEVIRERNSRHFSSLPLAIFLGSCNRLLVILVACWAYVPNEEH